jgi:phospholipid-binding lipoprotein MlaA
MPVSMRALVVMLVALLAGCATAPGRTTGNDRWESFNRGVYKFNDVVDRAALKPVAKGYKKITPHWMRVGIANFFSNLETPATALNQFLQGKPKLGIRDTGRFLLNSTLGVGGLLDVATAVGLEANDEDFGQTLAVWGVGSGPYVNLPFFGPSSLRDAPARIFDPFSDPLDYADLPWEVTWAKRGLNAVHSRAELLTLEPTLQRTYDPYAFIRDAWVQQREFEIFDGNPPPEVLDEEFLDEDEPAAESPDEPAREFDDESAAESPEENR